LATGVKPPFWRKEGNFNTKAISLKATNFTILGKLFPHNMSFFKIFGFGELNFRVSSVKTANVPSPSN